MKVSIIVPVLNEAENLPSLLDQLLFHEQHGCEVIIVDGGSEDGSADIATSAGFTVLQSPCSRARQMNVGAAQAIGDVLLFLHADTLLPDNAGVLLTSAMKRAELHWGRFDVCIVGRSHWLWLVGGMMNLRSRLTGIATGDQAIFVTRSVFDTVEGFPDQPLMEDVEISKRLRVVSDPVCIRSCVKTSGRRWDTHGVLRTILLMWRLRWYYWRGVPASELAKMYQ